MKDLGERAGSRPEAKAEAPGAVDSGGACGPAGPGPTAGAPVSALLPAPSPLSAHAASLQPLGKRHFLLCSCEMSLFAT